MAFNKILSIGKTGVGDWKKNKSTVLLISKKIQKSFKKENVFICGYHFRPIVKL